MSLPRPLDPVEIRVLGCLLEKERATPDLYPLTVNALVAACNQRSSRDPVMTLGPADVTDALDRLHAEVLVWPVSGARSQRWRHNLDRRLELEPATGAVLTLLMLRGPQTPGELRGRSDRLHTFATTREVEETLAALAARGQPLVAQLERSPGQKEARWAPLLAEPGSEPWAATAPPATAPPHPAGDSLGERVGRLEGELAALRERVARLERGA